jgi:hypothetical protein
MYWSGGFCLTREGGRRKGAGENQIIVVTMATNNPKDLSEDRRHRIMTVSLVNGKKSLFRVESQAVPGEFFKEL